MEIPFELGTIFTTKTVRLDSMTIKQLQFVFLFLSLFTDSSENSHIYNAIDLLSKQSARSLQLRKALTTCEELAHSNHVLYIAWDHDSETEANYLIGLLKIGRKKLFLYDAQMKAYEGEFVAVLDFYVHQSYQRQGHGRRLFDYMLNYEKVVPHEVALDSPTVTLLSFMAKHYGLTVPVWQNTGFVVFEQLFHNMSEETNEDVPEEWRRPAARHIGSSCDTNRQDQQHEAKSKAPEQPESTDQAWSPAENESSAANRSYQARQRKAQLLSSKPLW